MFLNIYLKGSNPDLIPPLFRKYEPAVIRMIPAKPLGSGNSLVINGDIKSKNKGVKLSIGTTIEISPEAIAL
ncbi:MAG: hypothetical protein Kow0098_09680 [Ignavibacteriaceae bacterium]